jgi:CHAT domain-containing protein
VATHGFFAEPIYPQWLLAQATRDASDHGSGESDSAEAAPRNWDVTSFHPELLSGIALAGANGAWRGGETPLEIPYEDGLLTALEVSAMDLSGVDLAVLSACETGLGDYRRGEGMLSLQRAFHMAGAPSVVASLWKVDDQTTSQLMQQFYANLWEGRMSKIEALRQAQITVLKEGQTRGIRPLDKHPESGDGTLPPYYWGAFVLSGGWR